MLQGNSEPSLLQLASQDEHARLRKHMQSFFTQENVDAVYTTLRDTVLTTCKKVAAEAGPDGFAAVDAETVAHKLIEDVVMKVCWEAMCALLRMVTRCALHTTLLCCTVQDNNIAERLVSNSLVPRQRLPVSSLR